MPLAADLVAAAVQMICPPRDVMTNSRRTFTFLDRAFSRGARLVVLPACFLTGLLDATDGRAMAETLDSPFLAPLGELARTHEATLVAAVPLKEADDTRRLGALVFTPEGLAGVHRQLVFATDAERAWLTPGAALVPFQTPAGRLGVLLGAELEYPELARRLARQGADVIAVCAASADAVGWDLATRARARENGVFVVAANQFARPAAAPPDATGAASAAGHAAERASCPTSQGTSPALCGRTRIVAPDGTLLAEQAQGNGLALARLAPGDQETARSARPLLATSLKLEARLAMLARRVDDHRPEPQP